MAVHIEVVELVPYPDRIEVVIEVDDNIPQDICCPWIAGQIGECFERVREHKDVAIRKHRKIVAERLQRQIITGRSKTGIEIGHGQLANSVAGKIKLP